MQVRFLMHSLGGTAGGVRSVILSLAGELAKHHDVELVALYEDDTPADEMPPGGPTQVRVPDGVGVRILLPGLAHHRRWQRLLSQVPSVITPSSVSRDGLYNLLTDMVLRRYLRTEKGGAVITMQPALSLALARFGTDDYLRVAQEHRPFEDRAPRLKQAYVEHGHRFDAFLTLTDTDTEGYRPLIADQVVVQTMPNGTPPWAGPIAPLQAEVAVAAGRLEPVKGFPLLVNAWSIVHERHPRWRLRIYGEGSRRDQLQAQIDRLGLTDAVILEGYTDDLRDELVDASFLVLSSHLEGYPMVLLEAMSCGLPVISVDCPSGPRDMVTDGENGFLVARRKPQPLAKAMITMIELDEADRHKMAQAALQRAKDGDQVQVARRWSELLEGLSSRWSSAPAR